MRKVINAIHCKFIFCPFLIFFFFSCDTKEKPEEKQKCCKKTREEVSDSILSDESIYNLNSLWKTQNKQVVSLSVFKGKIVIAAMIFTYCESACPRIISDLQRIENSFTKEELDQIIFLLISMDPERDTPERCLEFSKEHKLNNNWIIISSDTDATLEMANVLNVRVKKLDDGGFDHSNIIHFLNRSGVIVDQQIGLENELEESIQKIRYLLDSSLKLGETL